MIPQYHSPFHHINPMIQVILNSMPLRFKLSYQGSPRIRWSSYENNQVSTSTGYEFSPTDIVTSPWSAKYHPLRIRIIFWRCIPSAFRSINCLATSVPLRSANHRRWPNVGVILSQRRRCWPNSKFKPLTRTTLSWDIIIFTQHRAHFAQR